MFWESKIQYTSKKLRSKQWMLFYLGLQKVKHNIQDKFIRFLSCSLIFIYFTNIDTGHSLKDLILITLLFGALIGCWYAYQQKKSSQKDLHRMMKDMESLHKAELELKSLQKEFEIVKMEQESATTEKQNLEKRLKDETMGLNTSSSDLEVSQLKAEIEVSHI